MWTLPLPAPATLSALLPLALHLILRRRRAPGSRQERLLWPLVAVLALWGWEAWDQTLPDALGWLYSAALGAAVIIQHRRSAGEVEARPLASWAPPALALVGALSYLLLYTDATRALPWSASQVRQVHKMSFLPPEFRVVVRARMSEAAFQDFATELGCAATQQQGTACEGGRWCQTTITGWPRELRWCEGEAFVQWGDEAP